jgi:N-methylhydantoinase B
MSFRLGVDVGGTVTDVLLVEERSGRTWRAKTASTPSGDVLHFVTWGGGGWGDPLERDPALVLRDVRNDFVSPDAAREDYGVVLTGDPPAVDEAATRELREAMRAGRGDRPVPIYNWGAALAAE